jgi:ABC-2 type transport system permease protein
MIWLPLAMGGEPESAPRSHYLTLVCAYALLLLGDVCFWNTFGMDRSAAATWFIVPVPMTKVIMARNLATSVFIVLEVALVCLVCLLLRMPVTAALVIETYAVVGVLSVFLYAFGNLMSVRYPRPVDPGQSWRNTSSGRIQVLLLFAYPILGMPILLAYGARYAFEGDVAFYGVLLADLIVAAITYSVALESAAAYAERNSETIVQALSRSEGPIGA